MNLKSLFEKFDFSGGAALGILLLNVIGLFWYGMLRGKPVDGSVITYSLGIVAAYTAHGVLTAGNGPKNPSSNG